MSIRMTSARCPCTEVRRASRAITQLHDLVLSPTGLRATQFIVLFAIAQENEIAQCRLAENYAISIEALSRRLGSLRRKGLIQVRDGFPHHQRLYSLTEKGKKVVDDAMPHWNRAQARLRATVGEAELELLLKLCDRVVSGALQAQMLRIANSTSVCKPPHS